MARFGTERSIGGVSLHEWSKGAVGGFVGGIVFGLVIQFWMPEDVILRAIPSLYGFSGPAPMIGWVFHLVHTTLFGLIYAKIVGYDGLTKFANEPVTGAVAGAIYAYGLMVVITVIFSLAIFAGIDVPEELPLPYLGMISYFGFTAFGAVLGVTYAFLGGESDRKTL
ncbi:hypothetical protein [Natronococcus wangiae]|uniref:hypothetical protein n=1 Tax=Natronococcus wangiae TaxID=3068275 RepID=UPI00273D6F14|nr:hypothetical protein [Natronococcus sp. AD5]